MNENELRIHFNYHLACEFGKNNIKDSFIPTEVQEKGLGFDAAYLIEEWGKKKKLTINDRVFSTYFQFKVSKRSDLGRRANSFIGKPEWLDCHNESICYRSDIIKSEGDKEQLKTFCKNFGTLSSYYVTNQYLLTDTNPYTENLFQYYLIFKASDLVRGKTYEPMHKWITHHPNYNHYYAHSTPEKLERVKDLDDQRSAFSEKVLKEINKEYIYNKALKIKAIAFKELHKIVSTGKLHMKPYQGMLKDILFILNFQDREAKIQIEQLKSSKSTEALDKLSEEAIGITEYTFTQHPFIKALTAAPQKDLIKEIFYRYPTFKEPNFQLFFHLLIQEYSIRTKKEYGIHNQWIFLSPDE